MTNAATGNGQPETAISRAANSVWGLLLTRFVTPALVAACLFLFSNYLSKLDATIASLASQIAAANIEIDQLQEDAAASEARRDVAVKARDLDISNLSNEIQLLRGKTDLLATASAAQTARLEVVLDLLQEMRGEDPNNSTTRVR